MEVCSSRQLGQVGELDEQILSSLSRLDQAVVKFILGHGPGARVRLSHLAVQDSLATIAANADEHMTKTYFLGKPDVYMCKSDAEYNAWVAVVSDLATSLCGSAELTPRQQSLQELEEQVKQFIRDNDQAVVLSRFGANQTLKKLAKAAGVELKKAYFLDRPQSFRVREEQSGTIRVSLVGGEDSRDDAWKVRPEMEPSAPLGAAAPTSNEHGSGGSTPLTMVEYGILFVYRHSAGDYTPVSMNLFGLDQHLNQIATAEGMGWRRPFFIANHEFFQYALTGSTATVSLTQAGIKRAKLLSKESQQARDFLSSGNSSLEQLSRNRLTRLEGKVVEFLRSQPDCTAFLHAIAADGQLRKLADDAEVVLRKPFFESRPKVFSILQSGPSTFRIALRPEEGSGSTQPAPPSDWMAGKNKATPVEDDSLWIQLQKEIDSFFLEGSQRHYLLASVGNQPKIKKIASQLQVRIGKEYFTERRKQYVLFDSDKAKAMLVGLSPSYFNSLRRGTDGGFTSASGGGGSNSSGGTSRSSISARSGLAYGPDPAMRRLETIAVEGVLSSDGQNIPLPHLLQNSDLQAAMLKTNTAVNEGFFRRRPHLFSCTATTSGITCIGLPPANNRFNPLEQACIIALKQCPAYRSELGSLICSRSLERLVGGYTTIDIRIAKAFFMTRPSLFRVIQKGSRVEVGITAKAMQAQQTSDSAAPQDDTADSSAAVTPGDVYSDEKKPAATSTDPVSPEAEPYDEMAAWEEELADAPLYERDADEDDEYADGSPDRQEAHAAQSAQEELAQAQLNHRAPSPNTVLKDFDRFSEEHGYPPAHSLHYPAANPKPWPSQVPGHDSNAPATAAPPAAMVANGAAAPGVNLLQTPYLGYGNSAVPAAGHSNYGMTWAPQPLSYATNNPMGTANFPMASPALHMTSPAFPRTSHPLMPAAAAATSMPDRPGSDAIVQLPPVNEEKLDEAEDRLLSLAPSLAYALRRKRSAGVTERMVEQLQLARLRSELLHLQLRAKKAVLCVEEEFCGSGLNEVYTVRVLIRGFCYGEGRGSWKVARVEAMIDAAARLALEPA